MVTAIANIVSSNIGQSIYVGMSALDAAVTHFQSKNPRFFETMYKVRYVVNALNLGAIFYSLYNLWEDTGLSKYAAYLTQQNPSGADPLSLVVMISLVAFSILVGVSVHYANQYLSSKANRKWANWHTKCGVEVPPAVLPTLKVRQDSSSYKYFRQCIQVTQIVVSIALIFFSTTPILYGASAAFQLYSLVKTTQWKWIRFDRTFDVINPNPWDGPSHYTFSYFASLFPAKNTHSESCSVCLEGDQPGERKPNVQFCGTHVFHTKCVVGTIYGRSEQFLSGMQPVRTRVTEHGRYGSREYITYKITLPKRNLPCCPNCRGTPAQNESRITVRDTFRGNTSDIDASVVFV